MTAFEAYPLPHSALLFMAAVEEARLTNEGPIRAVAPLFRIALEHQRGQFLNVAAAARVLNPILGASFSEHALEAFLPQLTTLGWLTEARTQDDRAAYLVASALPDFDEAAAAESSLEKLDRLYEAFKDFLGINAPLLNMTITPEQFKWQLFKWATSLDGSSKEDVRSDAEELIAGRPLSIRNAFLDEPLRLNRVDRSLSVEFAGFVKWLEKRDRGELADVAALSELGLALEFLEELRAPTANIGTNIETAFVLDAPVLLDLLGLSGPSRQSSIVRCLRLVRDRGGKVVTLAHCLDELSDILKAVLDRPHPLRFGLTGDAIKADPQLAGRARQIASQPDRAAKFANVEVIVFDRGNPLNEKYFPDPLIDRFRHSARWHDHHKTEQRERDALSVAFVMRRRAGKYGSDVLDNPYVLVTRNSTFTRFSELFARQYVSSPDYAFGPAIETKTLAAILWMKFGSEADPDLPQVQLISACDRILASNGELLRKAERKIREYKDQETATILLSSQQAVLDLVIATGGSPEVIDAANGEQLMNALSTTAEERGRMAEREVAEGQKAQLQETIANREAQVQELAAKAAVLAAGNVTRDAELTRRADDLRQLQERQDRITAEAAEAIATRASGRAWAMVAAIWVALGLIAVLGQFLIWDGRQWWKRDWVTFIAGCGVIASSILFAAFSLRWLPPRSIDLPAALHGWLARRSIRKRLADVEPMEERNRQIEWLEQQGHL